MFMYLNNKMYKEVSVIVAISAVIISFIALNKKNKKNKIQNINIEIQGAQYHHQVGGHSKAKTGIRKWKHFILKPFQSNGRGEREHDFYKNLPLNHPLQEFIPTYICFVEDPERRYIQMIDITHGLSFPNIMDIKMGTKTYEPNADSKKIEYESSKFSLQTEFGFRVQGIKVYDYLKKNYIQYDKYFGRNLKRNEINEPYRIFFQNATARIDLIDMFIVKIEKMINFFKNQHEFQFIASSLLFVYENEKTDNNMVQKSSNNIPRMDLKLIDFAHVQNISSEDSTFIDEGMIIGLENIKKQLNKIKKEFRFL